MANTKKPKDVKELKNEMKDEKTKITPKNIAIIIGVIVVIAVVILYIYVCGQNKNEAKYSKSYLLDSQTISLEIKDLEEVSQILTESPTEYFILITYTGEEATYNLESGLKSIIDNYKLNDSFYYLNVTNIKDEDNYLARINNAFNTDKIKKVPSILYYKDGKIVDIVSRVDDNCINAGDFQKLLDQHDFEGQ